MDIPPEVREALPGVAGSTTALLFFRRGWPMVIALFVCGVVAAKYLGGSVSNVMGSTLEVAGYVTGLFSMAIIAKIIDTIQAFDGKKAIDKVVAAIVKRISG